MRSVFIFTFSLFALLLSSTDTVRSAHAKDPGTCIEGNGGGERGGGDFDGLQFVGVGREMSAMLREWRTRDPEAVQGIDVDELDRNLGTERPGDSPAELARKKCEAIVVISEPHVYLVRHGKKIEVDAANDPLHRMIILNRSRIKGLWEREKKQQIDFVLHEYLRFLGVPDHQYELSSRVFFARWERETQISRMREEAKKQLEAITRALTGTYEAQTLQIPAGLQVVEMSSDYKECDRTGDGDSAACQQTAKMIMRMLAPAPQRRDPGPDELFATYYRYADSFGFGPRKLLLVDAGRTLENGLADANDAIKAIRQATIDEIRTCHFEGKMVCAIKIMRRKLTVDIPNIMRKQLQAMKSTLVVALKKVDGYYEADERFDTESPAPLPPDGSKPSPANAR